MGALDDLNHLGADALRDRLSGSQQAVAATVRQAAEGGAIEAQLLFGQMLLDGRGVECDPVAAVGWFDRAARAGSAMGMNMVGRACELGHGVVPDLAKAAAWYRAAADRGLDWGMYNLATALALGRGVAEDRAEALRLFRAAAALGHAKSATMVGSFYEDGWVVARDVATAKHFYRRGAEGGDFRGQFNLARLLLDRGDIAQGQAWLRRAAASATPAFRAKMHEWQASHRVHAIRTLDMDAPDAMRYANASQELM